MLTDSQRVFFSRQLLLDEWSEEKQSRLLAANILIIGLGGLGAPLASILVRAGVGRLVLVDPDHIETHNLHRQSLYNWADVGLLKVDVAARALQAIHPWVAVTTQAMTVEDYFGLTVTRGFDLVIDCSDNFATRDNVNQWAVSQKLPLLSLAAIGLQGQVALLPSTQPCYACVYGVDAISDEQSCASQGVLPSTTAVTVAFASHQALMFLTNNQHDFMGKLWLWHGEHYHSHIMQLTADTSCTVCQKEHP